MESVGEQFRKARESQGASVSEAAAATRIKYQHIEAMEKDDFSRIAAAAYAKGFIKIYAEFLHMPAAPLIEQYEEIHQPPAPRPRLASPSIPRRSTGSAAGSRTAGEDPRRASEDAEPASPPRTLQSFAVRIALPVVVIVAVILLLSSLARVALNRGSDNPPPPARSAAAAETGWLIEDPPDAYLDAASEGGSSR